MEKNCAYALQCRLVDGRHTVAVLKLQEPEAPDASLLLTALPPPTGHQVEQRDIVRQRSRTTFAQPRALVEAAIARRFQAAADRPVPTSPAHTHAPTPGADQPAATPVHTHPEAGPALPPTTNGAVHHGRGSLDRYEPI